MSVIHVVKNVGKCWQMLANVGIKTCYIDKKTCQNLTNKTYKCW